MSRWSINRALRAMASMRRIANNLLLLALLLLAPNVAWAPNKGPSVCYSCGLRKVPPIERGILGHSIEGEGGALTLTERAAILAPRIGVPLAPSPITALPDKLPFAEIRERLKAEQLIVEGYEVTVRRQDEKRAVNIVRGLRDETQLDQGQGVKEIKEIIEWITKSDEVEFNADIDNSQWAAMIQKIMGEWRQDYYSHVYPSGEPRAGDNWPQP